ncbi:MAG: EndoU domain-containing protein [Schwartzia sp.]|nr:EndoU domain-containing protein [Schwartzia sp. (in: firmicutes)]
MRNLFLKLVAVLAAMIFAIAAAGCGGGKNASSGSGSVQSAQTQQQKPQKQNDKQDKKDDAKKDKTDGYTMSDVKKLKNTGNFSRNGLEHIFDGTVNKKGKATGYHYSQIKDSKGRILDGTRGKKDENGVFTAKVEVDGVKKEGFSSFYPEDWSPQDVVDAINTAYKEAVNDPKNPRGSLWIGHAGKLEIDMYLDDHKKILTAYPIHRGK